jgi:hypothetical protein
MKSINENHHHLEPVALLMLLAYRRVVCGSKATRQPSSVEKQHDKWSEVSSKNILAIFFFPFQNSKRRVTDCSTRAGAALL